MNKLVNIWISVIFFSSALAIINSALAAPVDCADTATTGVPKIECDTLLALFDATNGTNWTNSNNWRTDTNVDSWFGVAVANGHILQLTIAANNLTGTIPAEIGNLSQLERLSFAANQLTGPIPDEIINLTELLQLELYSNSLTGVIPTQIGNLSKLSLFDISQNQLTGSIPQSIGNLSNLKLLNLSSNKLTNIIPTQIGHLINLQQLNLFGNQLSGPIPVEIGNLVALEELILGKNQLTGHIPSSLGSLSNLKQIWLINNSLSGSIPAELGNLENLNVLSFQNNQLTGTIPFEIGNLTNLQRLNLSLNKLIGTIPSEFIGLTNLEQLILSKNQLTGPIPSTLGSLSALQLLYLDENQLTDTIPTELGNLTNLTELRLSGNHLKGSIPQSFSALASLGRFVVERNHLDADENAYAIIDPTLQAWFNAISNKDISQQTLAPLPGVTINPTTGLLTTEAGGTAAFNVMIDTRPTENVVIDLASSDLTEGTISPASLLFTPTDWFAQQTIILNGEDDLQIDGNQNYTITSTVSSVDAEYDGLVVTTVSVVNADDDQAGITVLPVNGLVTTEAGGVAVFTILLNTQPSADVTIGLASSNTNEGTPSTSSVTFNTSNWNTRQFVTVTGMDDAIDDGDQAYRIVTSPANSDDADYNGINPPDINLINQDNDSNLEVAGITVSPSGGIITTEAGGTASFTVVLNTQPGADVALDISSSDTTEGMLNSTTNLITLVFTTENWDQPQAVTITGVDDFEDDGDFPYTITTHPSFSVDAGYNNIDAKNVNITNMDDDAAGIAISPISGLITTEGGGTATFTVMLNSQPTAEVNLSFSTSDASEGNLDPINLIFTTTDWDMPQVITLTGVEDLIVDGDQLYSIYVDAVSSMDDIYNGLKNIDNILVINQDNDPEVACSSPPADVVLKVGFLPGQYFCAGDNSIITDSTSNVTIQSGAEVLLQAPVIKFGRQFSVESGGILKAEN